MPVSLPASPTHVAGRRADRLAPLGREILARYDRDRNGELDRRELGFLGPDEFKALAGGHATILPHRLQAVLDRAAPADRDGLAAALQESHRSMAFVGWLALGLALGPRVALVLLLGLLADGGLG